MNSAGKWAQQLGKFLTVGLLNTAVDLGVFFLLSQLAGLADYLVLAKAISYSCGILNSFFWNRVWTFRSPVAVVPGLTLFVLANLGSLFVNTASMYVSLTVLHLPQLLALALATTSTFLLNFTVSKFVVFRS